MGSILVINAAGRETRVALVENGHIAEFYLERKKDKGVVGNIYKGRVVRVLPGMQAAFVDIGLDKAAFLYVSDVVYDPDFARAQFELTEGEHEEAPDVPEEPEGEPEPEDFQAPPSLDASAAHEEELDIRELPGGELPPPEDEAAESPALALEQAPAPVAELPPAPMEELTPAPGEELTPAPETEQALVARAAEQLLLAPPAEPVPVAEPVLAAPAEPARSNGAACRGERRAGREMREQRLRERVRRGREDRGRQREREEEKTKSRKSDRIEDLLKVGQEVVVQISKDPIGTKGARLTSHISIPGRHLVFMPTVDHVGISRRISNEKERRRLRDLVERLRPPGTGFIVRTVAENVPQEKLESDIRFLIEVWNQVVRRNEKRGGPGLLHPDLDLILRATRDLFAHDVEKLVIDDRDEYERVLGFVTAQDPALRDRVLLHDNEEPIFDAYGIEQEIHRAVQRKVWLKSGGYLIIDQAEALTAIDVNSGRYVGKKSLEETITKINIEAAREIVYQLRLRNIGGIIICDFIDMEKPANRDKVFKALQEALGRDKAKTNVLRISELGLVEMTRKRVRESIGRILHEDCSYCDGQGFVKTATTVCYEIFREIRREAANYKEPALAINCHPDVARLLQGEERQELRHLMDRYNKTIQIKAQQHYHREQYDLYGRSPHAEARGSSGAPAGAPPYARRDEASEPPHRGERGRDRGHRSRDRRERNHPDNPPARGASPQPEREPQPPQGPQAPASQPDSPSGPGAPSGG